MRLTLSIGRNLQFACLRGTPKVHAPHRKNWPAVTNPLNSFFKQLNSSVQSFVKRLLLPLDEFFDMILLGSDLWKNVSHTIRDYPHKLVEERLVEPQRPTVANGSTQDTTQDVAAIGVTRLDAIRNRKT